MGWRRGGGREAAGGQAGVSCLATGANRKRGLDPLLGQWLRRASAALPAAVGTGTAASLSPRTAGPTERLWASAAGRGFAPPAPAAEGGDRHRASSPLGIYSRRTERAADPSPPPCRYGAALTRHRCSGGRSVPFLLLLPCPPTAPPGASGGARGRGDSAGPPAVPSRSPVPQPHRASSPARLGSARRSGRTAWGTGASEPWAPAGRLPGTERDQRERRRAAAAVLPAPREVTCTARSPSRASPRSLPKEKPGKKIARARNLCPFVPFFLCFGLMMVCDYETPRGISSKSE